MNLTTEEPVRDVVTHRARSRSQPVAGLPRGPLPTAPPKFVLRTALALRRFLLRFADMVCPPEIVLLERGSGMMYSQQLGVAARLGIADQLSQGHALTARELAERTHTDEDALHRTLRALATIGIFALDSSGRFSNNRISRALAADHSTFSRAMVEYYTSGSNLAAWAELRHTIETGRSAFARVHGMSIWQWFAEHPDEEETFAQAMTGFTLLNASQIAALYPFHEIARLCDVGGGRGTLLSELVLRNPGLRGVLYDGSGVISCARPVLERRGVTDRIECVAGSFFESVPEGHDAYLLKSVLHDWDDARCRGILSNVRRAIPAHGRLLLVEFILERNDTSSTIANIDMHMVVVCDEGRERSRAELEALLAAAGFRLSRVFAGATIAVLEALPV